jgi:hypothetical protein
MLAMPGTFNPTETCGIPERRSKNSSTAAGPMNVAMVVVTTMMPLTFRGSANWYTRFAATSIGTREATRWPRKAIAPMPSVWARPSMPRQIASW